MTSNQTEKHLEKKDLQRMFRRSLKTGWAWHYERQMHLGFEYMMEPILRKLYGEGTPEYKDALVRHLEFFNCTHQLIPFVGGVVASMEETNANSDDFDTASITQIKTALMGPLSGVGDSIFLGTIRVIGTGIGCSLGAAGNWLGAILFLLIFNVPSYLCRYFGALKGYELGTKYLEKIQKSHMMDKLMLATGIVGIMTVGGMMMTMVSVNCPITIGSGDAATTIQSILDGIMPGMLGLAFTGIYYWLMKKNVNVMWLILGTCIFGIICAFFGILG